MIQELHTFVTLLTQLKCHNSLCRKPQETSFSMHMIQRLFLKIINKLKNATSVEFRNHSLFGGKIKSPITTYLVREGYDNVRFCSWLSLLFKVEHSSYTMGTRALPIA